MARPMAGKADIIPHMPELLFHASACWRAVRDAQAEVDPCGRDVAALGEARASLEALAHHCTGQRGGSVLVDVGEVDGDGRRRHRSHAHLQG